MLLMLFLDKVEAWLVPDQYRTLVERRKNRLERYRTLLEQIKWRYPAGEVREDFPGFEQLAQYRWLPHLMKAARDCCAWVGDKKVLLLIDDYSTPRVPPSMQRVLNRLFLQRSANFLTKIATEASSTFVPGDATGKNLEDGDDFQLVDMGEESLFLPESERQAFLDDVFSRRLEVDARIQPGHDISERSPWDDGESPRRNLLGELRGTEPTARCTRSSS